MKNTVFSIGQSGKATHFSTCAGNQLDYEFCFILERGGG